MTKLALKGLLTRKLRSVLTGFAVVIGVAFVVGTLVFTDTIDASFKNLFERTQQGVDVAVEARQAVKSDFSVPPTMPADTLEKVKATPGVEVAEGGVSSDGTILDKQGEPIVSQGPPTLLLSENTEKQFQSLDYESGGPPQTDDEVALDRGTSNKYGFKVGDTVTVSGDAPAKQFKVSGVASLAGSDNLGGARLVLFTLPEARRMTGHDGFDSISIATGGNNPDQVKAALQRELGRDFLVRTGKEAAEQQAQDLSDALGFIRTALLVFAGVALLVGGFLIFNTFTVTVAQRTKEFALLRVLGASRAQILRSVLIETFAVGLIASVIGVLVGLVVAPGLAALMSAAGIDLGATGMVISPTTVIIGLVIGMVATMVSGFVPARRATRIEPVTAMRDSVTPGLGHLRTRRIVGSLVLMGLGLIGLFYGLFGGISSDSGAASLVGLGAVLMMFGVAFLAPLLVRPLRACPGRPAGRGAGPDRQAGARERDPPAAAHRGHRGGADGRPRARRAGGDLRRRPDGLDRQGHRRPGPGRDGRPEPGRLLADLRRSAARRRRRAGRPGRGLVPLRDRHRQGRRGFHDRGQRRRSGDRRLGAEAQVGAGRRRDAQRADRPPGRGRLKLGRVARPQGRLDGDVHHPDRQAGVLRGRRHLQEPGRPDRERDRPERRAGAVLGLEEHRLRDGLGHARAPTRTSWRRRPTRRCGASPRRRR